MEKKEAIRELKKIKKLIKGINLRLAAQWPEKWQILISTILSAQTKDEVTIEVCEILFKKYPSPEKLSKAKLETIQKLIRRINYYKTKSKNIIESAKRISKEGIPENVEDLLKFPGVGRKVANVYLCEAHKSDVIGVDTHVARISQKLGWSNNSNPHKIEKDLERLFPKKYYREINETLVTFGRTFSRSKKQEDEILEKIKV